MKRTARMHLWTKNRSRVSFLHALHVCGLPWWDGEWGQEWNNGDANFKRNHSCIRDTLLNETPTYNGSNTPTIKSQWRLTQYSQCNQQHLCFNMHPVVQIRLYFNILSSFRTLDFSIFSSWSWIAKAQMANISSLNGFLTWSPQTKRKMLIGSLPSWWAGLVSIRETSVRGNSSHSHHLKLQQYTLI